MKIIEQMLARYPREERDHAMREVMPLSKNFPPSALTWKYPGATRKSNPPWCPLS